MSIVGGLDIHREQLTFDYLDTVTGQVTRGQVSPADREHLRAWLARFAGRDDVAFAFAGCTGWRYVAGEVAAAGTGVHLAEPAGTAFARQPGAGFGAARAPFGVVGAGLGGGLECVVSDDGRAADRDPVGAGAGHLAGVVAGPAVRDGLGAVEVGAADVGLVAQQPVQGGGAPHGAAAGGGGHGVGIELTADLADGGPGWPTRRRSAAPPRPRARRSPGAPGRLGRGGRAGSRRRPSR